MTVKLSLVNAISSSAFALPPSTSKRIPATDNWTSPGFNSMAAKAITGMLIDKANHKKDFFVINLRTNFSNITVNKIIP